MSKVITLDELRAHNTKENLWVLLHEKGTRFEVNLGQYVLDNSTQFTTFHPLLMRYLSLGQRKNQIIKKFDPLFYDSIQEEKR